MKSPPEKISSQIKQLTADEDEQQELWVRHLEGNEGIDALSKHLTQIRQEFSEDQLLQITLWRRVYQVDDLNLLGLLDKFTDLEQSVMHLLAIGASLQEISSIKKIGTVRLRHIISVIRENELWGKINGTKT